MLEPASSLTLSFLVSMGGVWQEREKFFSRTSQMATLKFEQNGNVYVIIFSTRAGTRLLLSNNQRIGPITRWESNDKPVLVFRVSWWHSHRGWRAREIRWGKTISGETSYYSSSDDRPLNGFLENNTSLERRNQGWHFQPFYDHIHAHHNCFSFWRLFPKSLFEWQRRG